MKLAIMSAVLLALASGALIARIARSWRRGSWRSLVAIAAIAIAAGAGFWLLAGAVLGITGPTILVWTEPFDPTKDELKLAVKNSGATELLLVGVSQSSNTAIGAWQPRTSLLSSDAAFAEWVDKAPLTQDPTSALQVANQAIANRSWLSAGRDAMWLRRPRIVVAIGDRKRWDDWQPVPVAELVAEFRRREVQVDVVEIKPGPSAAHVEISTDLDLPADKPLSEISGHLRVLVRSAEFAGRAGQQVTLRVGGELNCGQATLSERDVITQITAAGLEFTLPLSSFRIAAGSAAELTPGFALCDVSIRSTDTRPLSVRGRAYLRVRRVHVVIVCGEGQGLPLRRPSAFDSVNSAVAQAPAEIQALLRPALNQRGGPIATYEFMSAADFAAMLANQRELPLLALLNELSPAELTPDFCKDLKAAITAGMNVLWVDPPVRTAVNAADLDLLLPAYTRRDGLQVGNQPSTIDRTPVLTFMFDYNRQGRGGPRANANVQDGLETQFAVAQGIVSRYRNDGLLTGDLQLLGDPNTPWMRRVSYVPNAADRVIVRVAPKFSLDHQDGSNSLGNQIIPSAIEMRLATLYADLAGLDRTAIGLDSPPTGDRLAELLAQRPAALPNQTVLMFVHRHTPQPQAGSIQSRTAPWQFVLDDDGSSPHVPQQNADGILAQLATRGVQVAVIGLALGQDLQGEQGVAKLVQGDELWGKDEKQPFGTFTLMPRDVLEQKRTSGIAQLISQGAVLKEAESLRTLMRGPSGPLFDEIDLMGSDINTRVVDLIKRLCDRWLPLHHRPRESMSALVRWFGPAIDERIAPAISYRQMLSWQADTALAKHKFPADARLAVAQRLRCLEPNPNCQTPAISTYLYGVALSGSGWEPAPLPLLMGAQVGAGKVFVLAYSPLELGPTSVGWDAQDLIYSGTVGAADRHGPSRLLDLAQFLSRRRPLPVRQPEIINVSMRDSRGGIVCTAEFLPQHTNESSFFSPAAKTLPNGGSAVLEPLRIIDIDAVARRVQYELSAEAVRRLCSSRAARRVEIEFLPNQPRTGLILAPAAAHAYLATPAADSIFALAGFRYGGVTPVTQALPVRLVSVRWWNVLVLVVLMLSFAGKRAYGRLKAAIDRRTRDMEQQRLTDFDAEGASETIMQGSSCHTTSDLNPAEQVALSRIRAGDDPRSFVRNDVVLAAAGEVSEWRVRRRVLQKTPRVMIVVQAGRSMRLFRHGAEPKLQLAGYVAELIAHIAFSRWSEVSLALRGLRGDWQCSEPAQADAGSGEISNIVAAAKAIRSGPLQDFETLEIVAGTLVIYISDWLEESLDESTCDWAQSIQAEGGQFVGIGVCSLSELHRLGFGWTPRTCCDRTSWTEDDVRTAYEEHFASIQTRIEQANGCFVSLNTSMEESEVVAVIEGSELLMQTLQG